LRAFITLSLVLGGFCLRADTIAAPALQWFQVLGGSGSNRVVAAKADPKGNFYITGNTSSLDFPVTSAAVQRSPGGSSLVRIDTATNAAQKLFPPGLSAPRSIVADPQNPQTLYATQDNYVWRSTDAGTTWAKLTAFPSGATVVSVAVDFEDSNTLYAGLNPQGVFKTTDGGITWVAVNNGIPAGTSGAINVPRVVTDPKFPQVVFAATDNALFRSDNGGSSWTATVNRFVIAQTLTFDPITPGTVYLTIYQPNAVAVSKSTDDGKTFVGGAGLPDGTAPYAILADPFRQGVVYAGSFSGIFVTTDSGATWTKQFSGVDVFLAADPNNPVLYTSLSYGIGRSTDGFKTVTPVGFPQGSLQQLVVAGPSVFVLATPSNDVYVVKLDTNGAIVYSTYFGGSANDAAAAMAVGSDGSVYVAGTTGSIDFPTTAGAYNNPNPGGNFVFKLNPDGTLAWSTYFADSNSTIFSVDADADGNVYIGGSTGGNLPTTPGAYVTQFTRITRCGGIGPCLPGPNAAFVTKLNAKGTGLAYSTYVPTDAQKNVIQGANALLVDPTGSNVYLAGGGSLLLLNSTGSAVTASNGTVNVNIVALARDGSGNVYAAGPTQSSFAVSGSLAFPASPGAFQPGPQPAIPSLPAQLGAGGLSDAFVLKWDAGLSKLVGATLLGGELADVANSIAVDSSGMVIVSGASDSRAFPTRAPFQSTFSSRAGFVSGLDSSLSHLLFSTYLGDGRPFESRAAVPDGNGNILLAGSTLSASPLFVGGDPGLTYATGSLVVANKIALPAAPAVRLDTVVNGASRLGGAIAPGEAIAAVGSGFGADAKLLLDGVALPTVSVTANNLVAVVPDNAKTSGAYQVQVSSGGTLSNLELVPATAAAPGIFSVDGSGYGQGYILNSDGTLNSPTNPAAAGTAITIFATGVGKTSFVGPYAVPDLPPAVFVDGFYASGIAAVAGPVSGLPGDVYQLSVFVPDPSTAANFNPNLLNFKFPPQVGVKLIFGAINSLNPDNSDIISQGGLVLNVK
jgi:uncharacterized protein (TIGR03437 family)